MDEPNIKTATLDELTAAIRANGFDVNDITLDDPGQRYLFDEPPYKPRPKGLFGRLEFLRARCRGLTPQGNEHIDDVWFCTVGYAEPTYDEPQSGVIAFGNWNKIFCSIKGHDIEVIDDAPERFGDLLEALGVSLEWRDEWDSCAECMRVFRTSPDRPCWKPSYVATDEGNYCHHCVRRDPKSFLREFIGNDHRAFPVDDIDFGRLGYQRLDSFDCGMHEGQDADSTVIGKSLRSLGISRYFFTRDGQDPYTVNFSVWVSRRQLKRLDPEKWKAAPKDGPSIAAGLQRALQKATQQMDALPTVPGHIKYARCNPSGEAEVGLLRLEELKDR